MLKFNFAYKKSACTDLLCYTALAAVGLILVAMKGGGEK